MDEEMDENCAAHDSPCCEVCAYERGYRAGIEAAATYLNGWHGYTISVATVANVRALAAPPPHADTGGCGVTTTKEMPAGEGRPAAPKAPERECPRCGGGGYVLDPTVNPVGCPRCAP